MPIRKVWIRRSVILIRSRFFDTVFTYKRKTEKQTISGKAGRIPTSRITKPKLKTLN